MNFSNQRHAHILLLMMTTVLHEGGVVGHEEGHLLATACSEHIGQLTGGACTLQELLGTHVTGRGLHVLDVDLLAGRCEVSVSGASISIAALAGQRQRFLLAILIHAAGDKVFNQLDEIR